MKNDEKSIDCSFEVIQVVSGIDAVLGYFIYDALLLAIIAIVVAHFIQSDIESDLKDTLSNDEIEITREGISLVLCLRHSAVKEFSPIMRCAPARSMPHIVAYICCGENLTRISNRNHQYQ